MDNSTIEQCALALHAAEKSRVTIVRLSDSFEALDEASAYAVQAKGIALRGAAVVGYKLGYTSAAMRAQMNIARPNFGVLTENLRIDEVSGCVDMTTLIHPLVEPEIALLVGKDICDGGHSRDSIFFYVDAAMPALEVVDTRYHDYIFKAVDNISDNSSSARFITGSPRRMAALMDLRLIGVLLWSGGKTLDQGIGANAMGDPLIALAWLANTLAARGEKITAGSVILTGGLTRAYPAQSGQTIVAEYAELGTVKACFQ